jgi:hypothetical protein
LNVWVEKGDLFFYLSKSGTFDENNTFLKLGRVRVKLSPNPFEETDFKQELSLETGAVNIEGSHNGIKANIKVWVDVYNPVVHVEVSANKAIKTEATYESWRTEDRLTKGKENNQGSWKWANRPTIKTYKDEIAVKNSSIEFYHRNQDTTVFDATVAHEKLNFWRQHAG